MGIINQSFEQIAEEALGKDGYREVASAANDGEDLPDKYRGNNIAEQLYESVVDANRFRTDSSI